jgi:avidin family protein
MGIAGIWYNELNSKMELAVNGSGVTGTYSSAVGDASSWYLVVGLTDPAPKPTATALGLVVQWANSAHGNSHSVTTWAGQYQVVNGVEYIFTFWLLTRETSTADNWQATLVGADTFQRTRPTDEQIALRQARGPAPHPHPATSG